MKATSIILIGHAIVLIIYHNACKEFNSQVFEKTPVTLRKRKYFSKRKLEHTKPSQVSIKNKDEQVPQSSMINVGHLR